MSTLFTKLINGEIKGEILYQDDLCAAILDYRPQAPKHILIIPKKELSSLADANTQDQPMLGHLLLIAAKIARDQGVSETGYRLVLNVGKDGGQSVDHLHIHLLGGRALDWPPG